MAPGVAVAVPCDGLYPEAFRHLPVARSATATSELRKESPPPRPDIMRYLLRQKMLSLADSFQIKNENGDDAFLVNGTVFSLGKKLALEDMAGNPLLAIEQQLMSWGPSYTISRDGAQIALVKKELFNFFSYRFTIELDGASPLETTGDFSNHEYAITRDGQQVAAISKQWFTMTDTYGVDVAASEDDVLILAIAVVIDMVCHPDQK